MAEVADPPQAASVRRRPFAPVLRVEAWLSVRSRRGDLPILESLIAPGSEVRILDLGGGTGGFAAQYMGRVARVAVIDPNPRKIAFARSRWDQVESFEGKAERLPFPDSSFDRVLAMLSFHHVEDPGAVLAETRRVLAPSGRFLLQEFHSASAPGRILRRLGNRHGGHHRFYEPAELRSLLVKHGFHDPTVHEASRGYYVLAHR